MLENWVYDYDTLKRFAVNAKGETIPRELVDQMNRARYFSLGMDDMRQLGLSNISLQYYLAPAPADLGAAARAARGKYDLIAPLPSSQSQDAFSHLSGYGAAYYTYRWSIVIADDMFTAFQKNGLRDPATAARYRDSSSFAMSRKEWSEMAQMMGVANMGGPAVGFLPEFPSPTVPRGATMAEVMKGMDHGGMNHNATDQPAPAVGRDSTAAKPAPAAEKPARKAPAKPAPRPAPKPKQPEGHEHMPGMRMP